MTPCEWCEELTDEDGTQNACMIAHCLECTGRCNSCQDDMKDEWDR